MTAHYKEVTKTVVSREEISCTCDRCGVVIPEVTGWWARRFTLKFEEGEYYGYDGGDLHGWEIPDLCDNCILLLRTLLETNGFTVVTTHNGD